MTDRALPKFLDDCPRCGRAVQPETGIAQRDGIWHRACYTTKLATHMGIAPFPKRAGARRRADRAAADAVAAIDQS